ncbi:MAG: hypothetical protein V4564_14160 [Pseudomonadota bacterium]
MKPSLHRFHYENARNSNYSAGGTACDPKALSTLGDRARTLGQADTCAKEAEDHRLQTNDLIQQTRAADAAEAQAKLAYQAGWNALFQTVGGFLTLCAAVAAAIYARDAANQTKRGADAAERAITETQRIGEAQVRCYLRIASAEVKLEEDIPIVRVTVANTGQTPALEAVFEYGFAPELRSDTRFENLQLFRSEHIQDIPSQGTLVAAPWHYQEGLTPRQVSDWKRHAGEVCALAVKLKARDVFGNKITAEEYFLISIDKIGDGEFHPFDMYASANAMAKAYVLARSRHP